MARDRRAVWLQRLAQWRESGLTAERFADEIGVNASTLSGWKYKVAAENRPGSQQAVAPARVEFVEVVGVPACAGGEERLEVVCLGGRTVRVPTTFDADALVRLLDVLERR